jgi:DNA-binding NtrC family response regulator
VIDEVDRLPGHVQERLAQFLDRGDVQPIGARHSFRIDVRLLACSNAPLRDLADAGLYHAPLVEALAVVHVHLPALRQRAGDIAALARYFLARIGEQPGLRPLGITDGALALLKAYDWPGNVRQLQATLFRAAVFCDAETLTAQDFPNLSTMVGETPRSPARSATARA